MRLRIASLLALALVAAALPVAASSPYFETTKAAPGFLARVAPERVGLDAARLGAFVESARLANSDALVVLKDGQVVVERYFEQPVGPIGCMSITKAVASLAIGKLWDEGKIRSLDEPVATWFPEWRADPRKRRITLRQVLTHTSGLGHQMNGSELYVHDDMLAFARGLEVEHEPGTHWEYSNAGAMLLAGIVQAAAGMPIDRYLEDKLFLPLGIVDWKWTRDKAGTPDTFGGLALRPRDLAKIGQLMLDRGRWQGRPILSARFVTEAVAPVPGQEHQALLWQVGYPDGYLMQTAEGLEAQYGRRTFGHDGWLGQYLAVDPTTRLVAVRMIRHKRADQENPRETFESFYEQFGRLAGN